MPPRTPSGARRFRYWWTEWDETALRADPRGGLLFPFTREEGIQADPGFPNRLRAATGITGFGYNYRYLGSGRVSATAIADPAGTVAFATSAQIDFRAPFALQGNTYLEAPSARYPTFHARHLGSGLVLWTDGHATSRRPAYRTDLRPDRATPAALGEIAPGPLDDSLFDLL